MRVAAGPSRVSSGPAALGQLGRWALWARGWRSPLRKGTSWGRAMAAAGIGRGRAPGPPGSGQRPWCPSRIPAARAARPGATPRPGPHPCPPLPAPSHGHTGLAAPQPRAVPAAVPRRLRGPFSLLRVSAHAPPPQRDLPARTRETTPRPGPARPRLHGTCHHNGLCHYYLLSCVSPQKARLLDVGTSFNPYRSPGARNGPRHTVGAQ